MKRFESSSARSNAFACLIIPAALLAVLAAPHILGAAFASGAEAEGGAHGITPAAWKNFGFRILNLAIFIGIIWYFAGAKIKGVFKGRTTQIASDLEEFEKAKKKAETELAAVEKRIADLEKERQAIIKEYVAQGEALKATIVAKAENSAEQIIAQAHRNAENESKAAMEALRGEMADLIGAATEDMLRKQLDARLHTRLIDKSLAKVVLQ